MISKLKWATLWVSLPMVFLFTSTSALGGKRAQVDTRPWLPDERGMQSDVDTIDESSSLGWIKGEVVQFFTKAFHFKEQLAISAVVKESQQSRSQNGEHGRAMARGSYHYAREGQGESGIGLHNDTQAGVVKTIKSKTEKYYQTTKQGEKKKILQDIKTVLKEENIALMSRFNGWSARAWNLIRLVQELTVPASVFDGTPETYADKDGNTREAQYYPESSCIFKPDNFKKVSVIDQLSDEYIASLNTEEKQEAQLLLDMWNTLEENNLKDFWNTRSRLQSIHKKSLDNAPDVKSEVDLEPFGRRLIDLTKLSELKSTNRKVNISAANISIQNIWYQQSPDDYYSNPREILIEGKTYQVVVRRQELTLHSSDSELGTMKSMRLIHSEQKPVETPSFKLTAYLLPPSETTVYSHHAVQTIVLKDAPPPEKIRIPSLRHMFSGYIYQALPDLTDPAHPDYTIKENYDQAATIFPVAFMDPAALNSRHNHNIDISDKDLNFSVYGLGQSFSEPGYYLEVDIQAMCDQIEMSVNYLKSTEHRRLERIRYQDAADSGSDLQVETTEENFHLAEEQEDKAREDAKLSAGKIMSSDNLHRNVKRPFIRWIHHNDNGQGFVYHNEAWHPF